ncbi:hypothetical protein OS493_005071 [Desmophyllum pertusum]|uniref:DUF4604 domain-containing protein n=1 Tax=Desmophyllum pertusum TaxID=174260 RepID=A0A9W9Z7C5_9CNID|nr:hypothetical protein OS493_005071 [Desmophyllum pertusum]
MAGKNISFLKPKTPSFIAKFKEKVGYQESDTVETKFEESDSSKLDNTEHEDEKPTVVLGSNVSEAEADDFITRLKAEEDASLEEEKRKDAERKDSAEDDGKIVFKKPTKRKSSDSEKDLKSKADDKRNQNLPVL